MKSFCRFFWVNELVKMYKIKHENELKLWSFNIFNDNIHTHTYVFRGENTKQCTMTMSFGCGEIFSSEQIAIIYILINKSSLKLEYHVHGMLNIIKSLWWMMIDCKIFCILRNRMWVSDVLSRWWLIYATALLINAN